MQVVATAVQYAEDMDVLAPLVAATSRDGGSGNALGHGPSNGRIAAIHVHGGAARVERAREHRLAHRVVTAVVVGRAVQPQHALSTCSIRAPRKVLLKHDVAEQS